LPINQQQVSSSPLDPSDHLVFPNEKEEQVIWDYALKFD
jgi:hypothetical protein